MASASGVRPSKTKDTEPTNGTAPAVVGETEGLSVAAGGCAEGWAGAELRAVGEGVGCSVVLKEGAELGCGDGFCAVGSEEAEAGASEGKAESTWVGSADGGCEGRAVGARLGREVVEGSMLGW